MTLQKKHDPKRYDSELVDAIASRVTYTEVEGAPGIVEEVRPIPDDDREHVFDRRALAMTRKKMSGEVLSFNNADLVTHRHLLKESHYITEGNVDRHVRIAEFDDRGIPLTILVPHNVEVPAPVLLYEHGGGFEGNWYGNYDAFLMALAEMAGCVIVFPEVRLAPENRFPAQVDDCDEVLTWIQEHAEELGVDLERVAIMGDSAGGSLVNATLLRRPHEIALAISLYPVCDMSGIPEWWSYDLYPIVEEERDAMLDRVDSIKRWSFSTNYFGEKISFRRHPEISAVFAPDEALALFPRTVIVCCEYDYLRPQDERFAAQLARLGVDVRLIRYAGLEHGFIEVTGVYPQAEDLLCVVSEEISRMP